MTNVSNTSDFEKLLGIDRFDAAAHREGDALNRLRILRPSRRPLPSWTTAMITLRPVVRLGKAGAR